MQLQQTKADHSGQSIGTLRRHVAQQNKNLLVPVEHDGLAKVIKIIAWNCCYWKIYALYI
jgi:hypothetical protein